MREQNYESKFFFYNKSKKSKYIKDIFKKIIDNSFVIKSNRKLKILNIYSFIRKPIKTFNLNLFINNMEFTLGFFIIN